MKDDTSARLRILRKIRFILALRVRHLEIESERRDQVIADLKRQVKELEDEVERIEKARKV